MSTQQALEGFHRLILRLVQVEDLDSLGMCLSLDGCIFGEQQFEGLDVAVWRDASIHDISFQFLI